MNVDFNLPVNIKKVDKLTPSKNSSITSTPSDECNPCTIF